MRRLPKWLSQAGFFYVPLKVPLNAQDLMCEQNAHWDRRTEWWTAEWNVQQGEWRLNKHMFRVQVNWRVNRQKDCSVDRWTYCSLGKWKECSVSLCQGHAKSWEGEEIGPNVDPYISYININCRRWLRNGMMLEIKLITNDTNYRVPPFVYYHCYWVIVNVATTHCA